MVLLTIPDYNSVPTIQVDVTFPFYVKKTYSESSSIDVLQVWRFENTERARIITVSILRRELPLQDTPLKISIERRKISERDIILAYSNTGYAAANEQDYTNLQNLAKQVYPLLEI